MSATPRTMRVVSVPSAPRFRRVVTVHPRPFGTISLFLVATGILGLTSLCYLWQAGQATSAALQIPRLNADLLGANNLTAQLKTQIDQRTSFDVVTQLAMTTYGMKNPTDPSLALPLAVTGPAVMRIIPVAVAVAVPVHRAGVPASVRIPATDAAVTAWWQDAWVALYKLLR